MLDGQFQTAGAHLAHLATTFWLQIRVFCFYDILMSVMMTAITLFSAFLPLGGEFVP